VGLSQWKTGDGSLIFGNGTIRDAPLTDLAALAGAGSTPVTGTLNATAQLTGTIGKTAGQRRYRRGQGRHSQ